MSTIEVTEEQHLTVVKHLAAGKTLDVVAAIMKFPRSVVLDIGSKHGFPSTAKLEWAIDVLEKKLAEKDALTEDPHREARARTATPIDTARTGGGTPAASTTSPPAPPAPLTNTLTKPDEIRILLNTGKQHPSKRIQAATDRAFDAIDKVRTLIREDQEKNAEKRAAAEKKAAARAEIERLERELADAKAKLRGSTKSSQQSPGGQAAVRSGQLAAVRGGGLATTEELNRLGVTSKDVRAWAHENDVECPDAGRLPGRVLEAWKTAHPPTSDADAGSEKAAS